MQLAKHGLGAALLAGVLTLAGSPAGAIDDIDSDCPEFADRSHAQILLGVEGRLKGDWQLAIRTTERSARRIKEKGEDPSKALLFVEVLKCLRAEVAAGEHADAVAFARGNPKAAAGASSGQSSSSGESSSSAGETVAIGPTPQPVSPAPAPAPAPAPQVAAQPEPPKAETKPVEKAEPPPATPPVVQGPVVVSGSGVALPGTAESYDSGTTVPQGEPQGEQQAALPLNAGEDYSGKACVYFTRPLEETVDGVRHINRYLEGEWVCHSATMYACIGSVWQAKGPCEKFSRWETRSSDVLEAEPRS
jgi:hypothetical protein